MSPSGPIPVRLILDGENKTVLTGSIRILPDTANLTSSDDEDEEPYDYHGAMLFIVLVIAVYAISIVMLIASFVKKKQVMVSLEETKNINQYLIQVSDLKEKSARENFKKLKRSIIEVVERSDSNRAAAAAAKAASEPKAKVGDNQALKHAIVGAGLSLYRPLIRIKEEEEGGEGKNKEPKPSTSNDSSPSKVSDVPGTTTRVVRADIAIPPRDMRTSSPQLLCPPSGSVTPDSPSGSDLKHLLNSPTSSTTPTSPGADSCRRLLLDPDSPSSASASPSASPLEPPEPVWQTRGGMRDDAAAAMRHSAYRNASYQQSPSPRLSRQKHSYEPVRPQIRQGLTPNVWIPLASSRTPSPNRRSKDNAVSSV